MLVFKLQEVLSLYNTLSRDCAFPQFPTSWEVSRPHYAFIVYMKSLSHSIAFLSFFFLLRNISHHGSTLGYTMMDAWVKKLKAANTQQLPQSNEKRIQSTDEPLSKRVKRDQVSDSDEDSDENLPLGTPPLKPLPGLRRVHIAHSEVGDDEASQHSGAEVDPPRRTAIESSLPEVKSEREALEEYENFRASQGDGDGDGDKDAASAASRLDSRKWIRGKTSLYVDAFNLALDTVLDEESHLFDEKEMHIFDQWNKLSYEAQFLYEIVKNGALLYVRSRF